MTNYADSTSATVEFRPRPSAGRYWAGGIGLGTLLLFVIPIAVGWGEIPLALGIVFVAIGLITAAPMLAAAWYFSSMRYRLDDSRLVLEYGPLMKEEIELRSIHSVRAREKLKMSWLASFRFPGLAVFDVDYVDVNRVRMCATSASEDILIIDAGRKRYGITPENEREFLTALKARLNEPEAMNVELGGKAKTGGT